jgi:hypothetical protein
MLFLPFLADLYAIAVVFFYQWIPDVTACPWACGAAQTLVMLAAAFPIWCFSPPSPALDLLEQTWGAQEIHDFYQRSLSGFQL